MAEQRAWDFLEAGVISDACVEEVLQLLDVPGSTSRPYVANYPGQPVQSMCIGLSSRCGQLCTRTDELEGVFRLLTLWMKTDVCQHGEFPFTSITINKQHAAQLHRDQGNVGMSVIRVVGNYTGGDLWLYEEDDGTFPVHAITKEDMCRLDAMNFVAFDGTCAHMVDEFVGERTSVIFFTSGMLWEASVDAKLKLVDWGAAGLASWDTWSSLE